MGQHRKHLTLGVIRSPVPDALGARRGGHTDCQSQAQLQGMERPQASLQRFVEQPPHHHRAKEGRDRAALRATATRRASTKPEPRRSVCGVLRCNAIAHPCPDTVADFS